MQKLGITLTSLALSAVTVPQPCTVRPLQLREERMTIEYVPAQDRAALCVEAESEDSLARVEVRDASAATVFKLVAPGSRGLALSGFSVETEESSVASLFETYGPGTYEFRARTVDGRPARGSAVLSHDLLRAPEIVYPTEGARGVSTSLIVSWVPDSAAAGYRVVLEQGETDGMAVQLPRGSSSFEVPSGVLQPGRASHLEVGALAANGNCTLVEVSFTTR